MNAKSCRDWSTSIAPVVRSSRDSGLLLKIWKARALIKTPWNFFQTLGQLPRGWQRIEYRDFLTGDKSWFLQNYNLFDHWGLQQMECQAAIQTENIMLTIFFGINRVATADGTEWAIHWTRRSAQNMSSKKCQMPYAILPDFQENKNDTAYGRYQIA
jgi:hypothetical protein